MNDLSMSLPFQIIDDITLSADGKALLLADDPVFYREEDVTANPIGKHLVMPWGADNLLPQHIIEKVEKSEIVGANIAFNLQVAYGQGPQLVRVKRDPETNRISDFFYLDDGPEYEFFERNDIPMYILNTLSDMIQFHNAFSELIFNRSYEKIWSIRNKEAAFSRWGVDRNGNIISHLYSADWRNLGTGKITASGVIDEYNSVQDVRNKMAARRNGRWVYPVYMPSPGRPYYSRPEWYSIFDSGWYTHSCAIPEIKKTILRNKLGVKFIIYVSPKYFNQIYKERKVGPNDIEEMKKVRNEEVAKMREFLSGAENAEKALVAFKEFTPAGSGVHEEKYIDIVPVENKMGDGEFISDLETSANVICYAMGIHSSLIGATPGKNSGSMSGTDKRELFMIKQSLMRGMIDRSMKALQMVRQVNGWPKDVMIILPEYIFTTLDQSKSGKEQNIKEGV